MKKIENKEIASPLLFRHYILNIPKVKDNLQLNAVKFALKALYPGNEDSTIYDYVITNNTVIGIAVNKNNISKKNNILLSNYSLISNNIKTGNIITVSNKWYELLIIKNGIPLLLKAFSDFLQLKIFIDNVLLEKQYQNLPRYIYFINENIDIEKYDIFMKLGYTQKDYALIYKQKKTKKSEIFSYKNDKTSKKMFIILSSLILISFLICDFIFYKRATNLELNANLIRQEYYAKKDLLKYSNSETDDFQSIKQQPSIYTIFMAISETSNTIRLISFDYDGEVFKFEAEKEKAIRVLNKLSELNIFDNLEIQQAVPQKDGFERFIIKGSILYDEK